MARAMTRGAGARGRAAQRVGDFSAMAENAAQAAQLLKALANEKRLLVLCTLIESGEASVGALCAVAGLSQSALSQHLARMREEGLVATRRDAQTIYYRIADPAAERILAVLHDLFCPPARGAGRHKQGARR